MAHDNLNPEELGFALLRHDISSDLANTVLNRLRERDLFLRFNIADWINLPPNLRGFIAASAHETAPDDPLLREQVTNSLLGLLALLDEAAVIEFVDSTLEAAERNAMHPDFTSLNDDLKSLLADNADALIDQQAPASGEAV